MNVATASRFILLPLEAPDTSTAPEAQSATESSHVDAVSRLGGPVDLTSRFNWLPCKGVDHGRSHRVEQEPDRRAAQGRKLRITAGTRLHVVRGDTAIIMRKPQSYSQARGIAKGFTRRLRRSGT